MTIFRVIHSSAFTPANYTNSFVDDSQLLNTCLKNTQSLTLLFNEKSVHLIEYLSKYASAKPTEIQLWYFGLSGCKFAYLYNSFLLQQRRAYPFVNDAYIYTAILAELTTVKYLHQLTLNLMYVCVICVINTNANMLWLGKVSSGYNFSVSAI